MCAKLLDRNILAFTNSYTNYIEPFIRYKRTFLNPFTVIKQVRSYNYPISCISRLDKEEKIFNNWLELTLYTYGIKDSKYNYEKRVFRFTPKGLTNSVDFTLDIDENGFPASGAIHEVFGKEDYSDLSINNCVVMDIGGNIGDTSIYFAVHGAKKVFCFEPFPFSYNLAVKNVKLNDLSDKIHVFNNAIGKPGFIKLDQNFNNSTGSDLMHYENGKKIEILSFDNFVNSRLSKGDKNVLKMDCEGCEYEVIMNANSESLNHFYELKIEYHYGIQKLITKLQDCGFKVSFTKARRSYNQWAHPPDMNIGYIYARKNICIS